MTRSRFASLLSTSSIKKLLTSFLAFQVATQPLQLQAADLIVDQSAADQFQPDLGSAPNGVPLIDIVTPNKKGLSHNKYEAYNVGTPGLILNNLNGQVGSSKLGGALSGNENLKRSGAARVILNEVTSTRKSLLEGTTEVFGSAADVVIANPNGLTCDGCGFINTPRVTLSSGVPVIGADETLSKLRVEGGTVGFGVRGADLGSVDMFDVLSQQISIEGPVKVKGNLSLIAGNNEYHYQTQEITNLPGASKGPEIAIDSSALGGMYAGSIKLISTSEGSGVRMRGDMAANTGQMHLTADGKIVLGKAKAKAKLSAISQNDSIETNKLFFSEDTITLYAAKTVTIADGALVGALGDVKITAETVNVGSNATLRSGLTEDGLSSDKAADLVLNVKDKAALGGGVLTSTGDTRISARKIDLSTTTERTEDTLSARGRAALNANEIVATGSKVSARQGLDIANAGALLMSGGIYRSAQLINITAEEITLDATLNTAGDIQITAKNGNLANSGFIHSDQAIDLTTTGTLHQSGTVEAIAGASLSGTDKIVNASGAKVSGSSLELTSGILENLGELKANTGSLTASIAQDFSNTGTIESQDTLRLGVDGAISNSGALKSDTAITINGRSSDSSAAALVIETSGTIRARSLSAKANSLSNKGLLSATESSLTLWSAGELLNNGTLETKRALVLSSDSGFQNNGTLSAGEQIRFNGGSSAALSNSATGFITGASGVVFNGLSLSNLGRLGTSSGDLEFNLAGDLKNSGLLYAAQNATLNFDGTFTNSNGDLIAEEKITLTGLTVDKAAGLTNENGGVVTAVSGDLIVKANSILNKSAEPAIQILSEVNDLEPVSSSGGKRHWITTYKKITVETEKLLKNTNRSKLLAGRDILLDGETIENSFGNIEANRNISIKANSLENKARDLIETTTTKVTEKHKKKKCKWYGSCKTSRWEVVNEEIATKTVDSANSTISAGGTLDINVSSFVRNGTLREGAEQIGLTSGNDAFTDPNNPDKLELNLDTLTELGFEQIIKNVQNKEHLFITNKDPNAPFLIETRADFINLGKFISSDYFLKKSGITKDELDVKRLGDGFVETRLIRDQIFELTGQRYLHDVANEVEQMQRLYDNAADMSGSLNLTFGVSLSPDQQAALTKDIVWLEKRMVAGQEVLVPVVYLAKGRTLTAGAKLTAKTVNIAANTVENSGAIIADEALSIDVADTLTNTGGQLKAGGDLTIDVDNKLTNQSGQIEGKNVDIVAGEIENITAVIRDDTAQGFADRAQAIASISATENLTKKTSGDLTSAGARLSAGKTLTAEAEGNVVLSSIETETKRSTRFKGGYDRSASLTNRFSEVSAGENLNIKSGKDLSIKGATLSSKGDASLEAKGEVKIAAVTDTAEHDFKLKIKGGMFGGGYSGKRYTSTQTVQGSNLDVENNLTIKSGADTTIIASALSAGEDMAITSGGALNVEGQSAESVSNSYTKSTGFLSKKSHTRNVSAQDYASSSLLAGGDLTMKAEQDLTVKASSVVGGGDVSLSGKNVSLETSETESSVFDQKKSSGFFAEGVDGGIGFTVGYRSQKDKVQQSGNTRIVSNVNAGKNLTITADNDLTSEAALLTAEKDIALKAGNDVKLTPAEETRLYDKSHKKDEIALTVAIRENISQNVETLIKTPQSATQGKGSGFNKAVTGASAALKAAQAAQALATGSLVTNEIGIGISSEKSRFSSTTVSNRVGQINAKQDLIIEAGRDILSEGTQITAGRNVTLDAGRDITLTAAETKTSSNNKSSERSAGIKGTFGVGLNGFSAGVSANVAGQDSHSNSSSNTKTNALVKAGRDVDIDAKRDVTLKGARVEGETITADVGRDLTIESVQDTLTSKNKSRGGSAGFSVSPNSVSVNGSFNFADGSAARAWVDEQSGLFGEKNVTVTVGGNTDLVGGIINSESGELTLDTGTLTFSDLQDFDKSKQVSGNLSASLGFSNEGDNALQDTLGDLQETANDAFDTAKDSLGQTDKNSKTNVPASTQSNPATQPQTPVPNTQATQGAQTEEKTSSPTPGGSFGGSYGSKDKRQITRATVGEGEIIIRDTDKQQELEDNGKTKKVASLNRDIDAAQEITKDEEEYVDVYVSDTAVKAAIKAGKTVSDIVSTVLYKINEPELAAAIGNKQINIANAINELRSSSCGTRQSSWFDWIISPAYAEACTVTTVTGKIITINDKQACLDALLDAALAQTVGIPWNFGKFKSGLKKGALEQGDEFLDLVSNPGELIAAVGSVMSELLNDPIETAERLGIEVVGDLEEQAYSYLKALNEGNYEEAGRIYSGFAIDLIVKVGTAGAGTALTGLKIAKKFKKVTKPFEDRKEERTREKFSGGNPTLDDDPYNPDVVDERINENRSEFINNNAPSHWGNPESLRDHAENHGSDFGITDPFDYAEAANNFFLTNNPNLEKIVTKDGVIKIYNPVDNTFGSYNANGTTKTFFKPKQGSKYWEREKEKND